MIYLVTKQQKFFENPNYIIISEEKSLELMKDWNVVQYDSETDGRDWHINHLLCAQFGNDKTNTRIVVDCTCTDITLYKDILENKFIIGQNLKFDIGFLYNYNIIPKRVYDTMIVEEVLNLGVSRKPNDPNFMSMALNSIADRRLGIVIDKTVRGEIIWRGLDNDVVMYAAGDVTYLEQIMHSQMQDARAKNLIKACQLECTFVPVITYLEWCGIKLDVEKWKIKMANDKANLELSIKELNAFVLRTSVLKDKFTYIERQGDLFSGFDTTPKVTINWASSDDVIKVCKLLGFNTKTKDKKTGEEKESAVAKLIKSQKGVNDEFIRLYYGKGEEEDEDYFPGYSGSAKVVSSFGQGHLNAINPITGRIHTSYSQLGADTGRMSCGSDQINTDLAKLKGFPVNPNAKQRKEGLACAYPNMQQLPNDAVTRSCFIAEKGNLWVSCDYSAIESRLGGDIYHEQSIIDEFLHGSGDMHSLVAKMVFPELKDVPVKEIKKRFPHLRSKAKPIEFSQQFGGTAFAIQNAMGCTKKEAEDFQNAYATGFPGIAEFKKKGSAFIRKNGYILICPQTGHKTYWIGWKKWKENALQLTSDFWEYYRIIKEKIPLTPAEEDAVKLVHDHFAEVSKWERKALNSVTQGVGAIILKDSQIDLFRWIVDNGYFGKIKLVNLTHDEANWEFPENLDFFPKLLQKTMEDSAAKYCKSLPIPAEASIGNCWIH